MAGASGTRSDGSARCSGGNRLVGGICQRLYAWLSVDDPRDVLGESWLQTATDGTVSITTTTSRRAGAIVAQAVAWLLWLVAIGGTLYLLQAIESAEGYHDARSKQRRETTSAVVRTGVDVVDSPIRFQGS